MSYGSNTEAKQLYETLLEGVSTDIPQIDWNDPKYQIPGAENSTLHQEVKPITVEELTERKIGGAGVFDALMDSFKQHLRAEYEGSRITGADYSKAYIELTQAAMSNATQFLLGRDQALWSAITAQAQAIGSIVQLETAKVQYDSLTVQALRERAEFALTKLRLATQDVEYGAAQFNVEHLQPKQLEQLTTQIEQLEKQIELIQEQTEGQRAQTLDTRTDGAAVVGILGKQKDLYAQQITSYQRDSELKATKVFTDAWITQKTIDEGLLPPDNFNNSSVNSILGTLKSNNNLG